MDIFSILEMTGGLCLFLFGVSVMGQALEKSAGGKLRSLLSKMTGTKITGFLTGLGVTAIINCRACSRVIVFMACIYLMCGPVLWFFCLATEAEDGICLTGTLRRAGDHIGSGRLEFDRSSLSFVILHHGVSYPGRI